MSVTKAKKFGLITLVSISTIVVVSIFFLFVCGLNFKETKKEPPISENEDKDEKKKIEEEKRTLYYLEF